jgi:hypothetical protein
LPREVSLLKHVFNFISNFADYLIPTEHSLRFIHGCMGRMLAVVACIHLQRRAENAFCTAAVCLHVTNFACQCDGVLLLPYASSFFARFRA